MRGAPWESMELVALVCTWASSCALSALPVVPSFGANGGGGDTFLVNVTGGAAAARSTERVSIFVYVLYNT